MRTIDDMAREYAEEHGPLMGSVTDLYLAYLAGAEQERNEGWRKTTEELPTDFSSVLAIYPDNECLIAYYDKYMKVWRDTTNHNEICPPLAWRKLPEYNPNL